MELDRRNSAGQRGRAGCSRGNGREVRLSTGAAIPSPAGRPDCRHCPRESCRLDFNYDFKTDLALAGAGGLRLLRQTLQTYSRCNRTSQAAQVGSPMATTPARGQSTSKRTAISTSYSRKRRHSDSPKK